MRNALLFICFIFTSTIVVNAQDKTDDIINLFELMNTKEIMNSTMENMKMMFQQQYSTAFEGNDLEDGSKEMVDFIINEVNLLSDVLINDVMVGIYDKHFTHEEIKKYIDFYKTEAGQKMVKKTPQLMTDMTNTMMMKYIPDLQKKMEDRFLELKGN